MKSAGQTAPMKKSDYFYDLPQELIAQEPNEPRDHSRLLVLDRQTGGIQDRHFYNLEEFLKPGDCLFLYTDGVTEATNAALELYGEKRLEAALNADAAKGLVPDQLLPYAKSQVDLFVSGAPQADDITMLGLRFCEYMPSNSKEETL